MSNSQSTFEVHRSTSGQDDGRSAEFEPILETEEAAQLLHIHPKTLQKKARSGEIPGFRVGKIWAFRRSALNKWIESKMAS
jgi:excisionase family DNA binding protein